MKKKTVIWVAIIVAVVIGALEYIHDTPGWVSISNAVSLAIGVVVGWIAHVLYNKYIKE